MKKRFFVYLSVIVGCLFIGLTTFYLVKSYEVISATGSDTYYLNINESDDIGLQYKHRAKKTKIEYSVSKEGVISFDVETGEIKALSGGSVDLTVIPSNEKYGPFSFKVFVGDGENETTPFYIKDAEDLKSIGKTRKYNDDDEYEWGLDAYYQLSNDIDLKGIEWEPIGKYVDGNDEESYAFTGQLFGENYYIKNLKITQKFESAGLFAYLAENAVIESIKFENASLEGIFDFSGIVAGVSYGASIKQIEIVKSNILLSPNVEKDGSYIEVLQMSGGVVGYTGSSWEKGITASEYIYDRTNITMCSFSGKIELSEDFAEKTVDIGNSYIIDVALGGIVGYNDSAIILNNKAEVQFRSSERLSALSDNNEEDVKEILLNIGGVVGVVDVDYINAETPIQPLIKNNLAIIEVDFLTEETNGVIGKITEETETVGYCVFGNFFFDLRGNILEGGSSSPESTTKIANQQLLKSKETYKTNAMENWDMGEVISVWSLNEEDLSPRINFESGMEQDFKYLEEQYKITSPEEFKYYYERMTATFSTVGELRAKKFWLSQNYILESDINLAEAGIFDFVPIGYDYSFKGSFDGNGHKIFFNQEEVDKIIIKNIKEDGGYKYESVGFFSINRGIIKNLEIENLEIDFGEFAGVIAGVNYGSIIDCLVVDPEIKDGIVYGLMVGVNSKDIINTNTEYFDDEIPYSVELNKVGEILGITDSKNNIYVGGVAGINTGRIENIKISGELMIIAKASTNNSIRVIGGFVGYNEGEINNSSISKAYISDSSKSKIFIGGFGGINDGLIIRSYTGELFDAPTTIETNTDNGKQIAAGFVARLGYEGEIKQSFANVAVKGYYISGFAAKLFGKTSECYVKGSLAGEYVGGFAITLSSATEDKERGGEIINSYTVLKISGLTDNSVSAGIAVLLRNPGKVETSFFSNTFSGKGLKFLETFTSNRSTLAKILTKVIDPTEGFGQINNVVIDFEASGNDEKEVVDNNNFLTDKNQKVFYISKNEALNAYDILVAAKFNVGATGIWTIEEGYYPILSELDLDDISQIAEEENSEDFGEEGLGEEGLGEEGFGEE